MNNPIYQQGWQAHKCGWPLLQCQDPLFIKGWTDRQRQFTNKQKAA